MNTPISLESESFNYRGFRVDVLDFLSDFKDSEIITLKQQITALETLRKPYLSHESQWPKDGLKVDDVTLISRLLQRRYRLLSQILGIVEEVESGRGIPEVARFLE